MVRIFFIMSNRCVVFLTGLLLAGTVAAFSPDLDRIESAWISDKYPAGTLGERARAEEALDAVKQARREAEDQVKQQRRGCYGNFLVNRCINDVRQAKLRAEKRFLAIEIEAKKTVREAKAQEEVERQAERDAKHEEKVRQKEQAMSPNSKAATPDAQLMRHSKKRAAETKRRQVELAKKAKKESAYEAKYKERLEAQKKRAAKRDKALADRAKKKALKAQQEAK